MNAIGRRTLTIDGKHVVVGPWTLADLEELARTTDVEEQCVIFGRHVEETPWPLVDFERLIPIVSAWAAEVNAVRAMLHAQMVPVRQVH